MAKKAPAVAMILLCRRFRVDDGQRARVSILDRSPPLAAQEAGITRRGEDVVKKEDEAGRRDTGTQGPTERPTGTSDARDYTSVYPKEVTSHDDSPAG